MATSPGLLLTSNYGQCIGAGGPVLNIREIDHLVLWTGQVENLVHFYRDVLGCALECRADDIGPIQLGAGRSLIDLVGLDGIIRRHGGAAPGDESRNLDHLCLRLEPFDEDSIRSHLRTHYVEAREMVRRYGGEETGPSLLYPRPRWEHRGAERSTGRPVVHAPGLQQSPSLKS
jgi:catechol 2,3-dioxygenase-like lactoylglutathione lyase family enzyme